MSISRRRFLETSTAVAVASLTGVTGCTELLKGEQPLYDQSDKDRMIPGLDVFPEGWQRKDEPPEGFDAAFNNSDETVGVMMWVLVFESVEEARAGYRRSKERYEAHDYSIADEGFWAERSDRAVTTFRHSNAVGQTVAFHLSVLELKPYVDGAQIYADKMFNHWQTI